MNKGYCLKVFKTIGLALILGVSLTACGAGKSSWKEEVLLHDGSKIIVERSVDRGGRHEIGQQPPIKEQSLSFTLPSTNDKVTWEDNFTEDIGGANFLPMMLEMSKGIAYLVVYPMGCISYNKWGRPNPPYVVFKYEGKAWKRITLNELPIELKTPNLIFSSPDDEAKKLGQGVVSAVTIKKLYDDTSQPQFKTILREAIANAGGSRCDEMVPYGKGGWLGLDWFSDQPTNEACVTFCEKKGVSPQNCPCQNLFKGKK